LILRHLPVLTRDTTSTNAQPQERMIVDQKEIFFQEIFIPPQRSRIQPQSYGVYMKQMAAE